MNDEFDAFDEAAGRLLWLLVIFLAGLVLGLSIDTRDRRCPGYDSVFGASVDGYTPSHH